MGKFLIRVQLTNETFNNYVIIRDALLKIGFTKRIKNTQGVEYRLPTGNYYIETTLDVNAVYNAAANTVLRLDPKAMIVLVEVVSKTMTWANLQRC